MQVGYCPMVPMAKKEYREAAMDYELVAANVRASYREVSPKYRQDDEVEVTTENHHHYSSILLDISSSFDRPVSVLDTPRRHRLSHVRQGRAHLAVRAQGGQGGLRRRALARQRWKTRYCAFALMDGVLD